MKSYLRFLSRNKLYTLIQLIGLSLSLAFVILLSSFIIEELSYNKVLEGTEDIYLCCIKDAETTLSSNKIPEWTKDIPELEECSRPCNSTAHLICFYQHAGTKAYAH